MANQEFSIQKKIFEVGAFSTQHAHELQNRISNLVNYHLIQQMENYFMEVIPENLLLRMDQLVLDIGEVNWDSLEEEIGERILTLLENEFSLRLQLLKDVNNASLSGISIETILTGKLELFEYFLLNGVLPWYADSTRNFSIDHLVNLLYDSGMAELRTIIVRAGKNENVRRRISYQFSEKSIHRLINTIEPAEAQYIFQTHKEITRLQKDKQIVQAEAKEFDKTIWLFIMNYLLVEMSSEFSRKMFVRSSLAQMAGHFNISYHLMLDMFYKALEAEQPHLYTPLQSVIYELVAGDIGFIPGEKPPGEIVKEFLPGRETLVSKIELLQYYFRFGTLPYAWNKIGKYILAGLLLQVAKAAPLIVRDMLFSIHASSSNDFRLHQLLDPLEIKDLVRLIFIEKERELEEIAATFQAIQGIHPFLNLNAVDLSLNIWKYLLETLLHHRYAESNEKTIIKSVIKRLGMQYGTANNDMLYSFEDSLQKIMQPGSQSSPLVTIFQEVVDEMRRPDTGNETEAFAGAPKQRVQQKIDHKEPVYQAAQLYDVLQYVLRYGNIPWWARRFYQYAIAEMMHELYESDPKALSLLLRQAALFPQMKERLLLNITIPVARALMHELPNGKEASVSLDQFFMLLDESKLMRYHDEVFVQKTIFSIALDVLGRTGYALFSDLIFYIESIIRLSAVLDMEPELFVIKLAQTAKEIPGTPIGHKMPDLLYRVQNYLYELKKKPAGIVEALPGEYENPGDLMFEKDAEKSQDDFIFPESKSVAVLQKYFPVTETSTAKLLLSFSDVLRFYLHWNRLPDSFGIIEGAGRKELLRELLFILFQHERIFLKRLLHDEANSTVAQMSLNELFSESEGGKEKEISSYLLQNSLPQLKKISTEKQYPVDYRLLEPGNNTTDLANIFFSEEIIDEKKADELVFARSFRTLEYFLKYNRIPDDIDIKASNETDKLLMSIMVLLFTKDRAFIREQFQKPGLSLEAKLHLYDLLAMANDTVTDQLLRFIEEWREEDFIQLLSQRLRLQEPFNKEETVSLLTGIFQNIPGKENQEEIEKFFSSSSFAKMILDKYGFTLFFKMAAHKIKWSSAGDSIIRGWLNFIQKAIPQGIDRQRFIDLFKRFNIIFISGQLDIYSDDSYTNAFIKYLSAYPGADDISIYKGLLEYASSQKPIRAMDDQKKLIQRLLVPVILQMEETKLADDLIRKKEGRNLSVALEKEITLYSEPRPGISIKEASNKSKSREEEEQKNYNKFTEDNGESIYIANAGLVLFHPFLETYFSRTGLMQKGRFIDIASRNRGALLLQYLANGKTGNEEHELVLNKILCNVPATEAIPVVFIPTEQEIDVSAELFRVFIERWPKMKNSTAEGLRASFILREGMLKIIDGNWNMKVEQKGYDILLQSYPWAFSYIKTPWMENTLIVEWI